MLRGLIFLKLNNKIIGNDSFKKNQSNSGLHHHLCSDEADKEENKNI